MPPTTRWGDVDRNGSTNLGDAQLVVLGFQGNWTLITLDDVDLAGSAQGDICLPNLFTNLVDVFHVVASFQGVSPSFFGCENPCP